MTLAPPLATAGRDGLDAALLPFDVPVLIYADEWGGLGGTAGYVRMLAEGFVARGYRTGVLCHDVPPMNAFMERLESSGVEVLRIRERHGRSPWRRVAAEAELVRLCRRYRGGVLALMMGYHTRGGGVSLAGRLAGMRAVVRADLTPPEPPFKRLEGTALRLKDRLVDAVVVGAEENIGLFEGDLGRRRRKLRVINTGIEVARFTPLLGRLEARRELELTDNDILVGTLCRLSDHRKGVDHFLEMAAAVARRWPRARFVVVGEGVLKPDFERQARALGIESIVSFPGWSADPMRWYAAMDVFVMASTHEGGPTTLLEAMAMRLPVVATSVGMVPEVVDDGVTGLIRQPAAPAGLAGAVSLLLNDPQLRVALGNAAREQALRSFSVNTMVERYLQLFAEVSRRS